MKKKTYHVNIKRKHLVQEALSTARAARENIDPALLDTVRQAIGTAVELYQNDKFKTMQADKVPVDQKKNLTTVMKYLDMHPDNKALHHEVQSFLTRH